MDRYSSPDAEKIQSGGLDSNKCFAYGCPCVPTLFFDNTWSCRWHHGRRPELLQQITRELRNNDRLVKWHDQMFSMTVVDFDMGEIAKKAPYGLGPEKDETYSQYKRRIRKTIEDKLYQKVVS